MTHARSLLCWLSTMVHQFIVFGNIKNRQPAYASLGYLEDPKCFFSPQKPRSAGPPKLVLLENSTGPINNFFKFFYFWERFRNVQRLLEKFKIWVWKFDNNFFKSLKRVKNCKSKMSQLFTKMNFLENVLLQIILSLLADIIPLDDSLKILFKVIKKFLN